MKIEIGSGTGPSIVEMLDWHREGARSVPHETERGVFCAREKLFKGPGVAKAPAWHCKNARSLDSLAFQ